MEYGELISPRDQLLFYDYEITEAEREACAQRESPCPRRLILPGSSCW